MAENEEQEETKEEGEEGAEASSEEVEAKPKKKRKLFLLLGIGGIGLLAAGGGGFFIMQTLSSDDTELAAEALPEGEEAAEGESADGEGSEEEDEEAAADAETADGEQEGAEGGEEKPEETGEVKEGLSKISGIFSEENQFGETFDVPKMELNLGNPLENRFLRFGVSIEYHGGEEQLEALQKRLPQIRDIIISIVSRKTRIELLSPDGKENLRKQIKNTFNEVFEKPVTNIYFTEFLVE